MDGTHGTRETIDNQSELDNERRCVCGEEGQGTCYVLMNSREYGTEVWPCKGMDEAVETLARLARAAEQRRREDGIQRYFCIRSERPEEREGAACDPVSSPLFDTVVNRLLQEKADETRLIRTLDGNARASKVRKAHEGCCQYRAVLSCLSHRRFKRPPALL